jgi:dolichol-phosphate mannosyltransferase
MAASPALSVVLPAYMEEENLRQLLPRLTAVVAGIDADGEIVVVDTLSPMDNTAEVCKLNRVRYVNRQGGNFFGDAVRTGIQEARGEFVVFMDADGSHPPEFIRNLWKEHGGADVVIASRYIEGGATDNSRVLVLMSLAVNLVYSVVLGLNCKDVSNSFKLYRGEMLKELTLKCNNFDIVEEILFKIKRNHRDLRIRELPFTFRKRMFGSTKRNLFVFIFSFIATLLRLRFGK